MYKTKLVQFYMNTNLQTLNKLVNLNYRMKRNIINKPGGGGGVESNWPG